MIYITGDSHGEWQKFQTWKHKSTKDDVLIVLGDFGLAWNPTTFQSGIRFFEKIPATVIAIKGNHENYDDIAKMNIVDKYGARMHQCSDNVFYVRNSEIMEIENRRFFCFGGGKSIDKEYRHELERKGKAKGKVYWKLWWEQELPTPVEFKYGRYIFQKNSEEIDFILTHEAPVAVMRQLNFDLSYPEITDFMNFLALYKTNDTKWLFGHLHMDKYFGDNMYGLYHSFCPITYYEKS